MSRKGNLLARLKGRPKDFSWTEACTLMRQCGYELRSGRGSARMFLNPATRHKVRLHEPHPDKTLKRYMVDILIQALTDAGEIDQ